MADNMPGQSEFSAAQEKSMRAGRRASFDPQGGNDGGVNMPGRLSSGRPAVMRSESTEHEKAQRADPGPASLLQHLVSPQSAGVRDAISSSERRRKAATGGYDE